MLVAELCSKLSWLIIVSSHVNHLFFWPGVLATYNTGKLPINQYKRMTNQCSLPKMEAFENAASKMCFWRVAVSSCRFVCSCRSSGYPPVPHKLLPNFGECFQGTQIIYKYPIISFNHIQLYPIIFRETTSTSAGDFHRHN